MSGDENVLSIRQAAIYTLQIMTRHRPIKRFTPQEYYELERLATYKSDFYRGEIFAMAGGTVRHSRICSNIILVSQDRAHVEILQRQQDGSWSLREVDGLEASLTISPINIDLPLAEIYARVDFGATDSAPTPA